MDIMPMIEQLLEKAQNDDAFKDQLIENAVETVEKFVGMDLPDDQIKAVADGVLAKLKLDDAAGLLGGLKKLF